MAKKIFLIILGLVVVGGVAWYVDRNFMRTKGTNSTQEPAVPESDATVTPLPAENTNKNTSESIVFLVNNENSKEIIKSDVKGSRKTLFTDEDEEFKIQKIGGLAYYASEVLVLTGKGDPSSNKLEGIKTDGSGKKETIVGSFGDPAAIAISPDGKSIGFVSFSNVEEDYGYSIYTMTRDGSNRRKQVTADKEIRGLSWNKDSNKVAFIKLGDSGKSTIQITDVEKEKTNEIFSTDKVILGLTWNESGKISFSVAPAGKLSESQFLVINPDGGNQKKIFETTKGALVSPALSSDNLNLAYALGALKDKIEEDVPADVYIGKSSGKNLDKIQKGNLVIC